MIPDDIDLTEKFDFRKIINQAIPQLPKNWKKEIPYIILGYSPIAYISPNNYSQAVRISINSNYTSSANTYISTNSSIGTYLDTSAALYIRYETH